MEINQKNPFYNYFSNFVVDLENMQVQLDLVQSCDTHFCMDGWPHMRS